MSLLPRKQGKEIKEVVRLLDSSPIQLRGYGYDEWTKEHETRQIQGIKLHVEYDLALEAPVRTTLSHPNCNDVAVGQKWLIKPETIYVFDKGYYDFNWWWDIELFFKWIKQNLKLKKF